ncbi:hypothetical protein FGE12_00040 [Aggregicoccus sp. 17bor-14]|uniref:hypothetical protein n=1 Tax=Myxococcaceae TaxID=31 RepID=UPI00129CA452|nr:MULTISPECIES: hypothetical protein [Myxococcaceae]MBF5040766.1 hypothetical protein [Simulacricoccus sp. 17bor-14]MRI86554.1 hypothetical protein [Aggregicoccus sp. 17bor-14]
MSSRRFTWLALAASALLSLDAAAASPASPPREAWAEGLTWEPQPVRVGVRPETVRSVDPRVPASAREVRGTVEVGPEQGAALWLSALEVARVVEEGSGGAGLRFVRVPAEAGADAPSLQLEERAVPARPGLWYLTEPVGAGSVWVVTASRPTRLRLERPALSEGVLGGEPTRAALLAWLDGRAPAPALAFRAGLRAQLERDAQLGEALRGASGSAHGLDAAVAAWRKAAALRAWSLEEPLQPSPALRLSELHPPGAAVDVEGTQREYARLPQPQGEWSVELEGPGVLQLQGRALLGTGSAQSRALEVREGSDAAGRVLGQATLAPRAALADAEDAALPAERRARTLASGEQLGVQEELRVVLSPGRHRYRVAWQGGALLLRARVAQRRPELREVLSHSATWESYAQTAWEAVKSDPSAPAALLRQELGALLPDAYPAGTPPGLRGLPLPLQVLSRVHAAEAAGAPERRAALALEAARELGARALPADALGWDLRLRLARLLLDTHHAAQAHAVLAAAPAFPESGWVAAQAAELVARLPLGDPLRSRGLAALELAWRKEPLSSEIRRRYLAAWWQESRWNLVSPSSAATASAQQWLDIQPPQDSARAESGALWALSPGQDVSVNSAPSAGAQTLLRAFVVPPAAGTKDVSAPLALRVGATSLPLAGVDPVEPVELALPAGAHALRLEGPPATRAFLSLAPQSGTAAADVAYVRTGWPLRAGAGALRFRIPDPQLPTPVRLQLRAPSASGGPVRVTLHTDVGPTRRLVLYPAAANAQHLALDGSARPSPAAAAAVVMLPPLTREVWLELEKGSADVAASLAVRRDLPSDEAPSAAPALAAAAPERPVEQLLALSRQVSNQPRSARFLLARAELLLALGEEGLARADLGRVTRLQEPLTSAQATQLNHLIAMAEGDRSEVRLAQPASTPTLLAPAFPALEGAQSAPVRALLTTARERGAKAALALPQSGATPAERYVRARLQARAGEPDAAALSLVQLYRETGRPQVGLEALALLDQLQPTSRTWAEGGAPLGSAIAVQLGEWADLPLVRRMRTTAGRWTRWERLRDAEQAAGHLEALQRGAPQERAELVRKALLAPPWPLEEARLLSAGRASVLDLETAGAQRLGAQVQCSPATLDAGDDAEPSPCTFTLRVDGATALKQEVQPGGAALLAAPLSAPGRHQLELLLAQNGEGRQAAVRFVALGQAGASDDGAQALQAQQPLSLLRSRPGQPVVMTVLGPTALRVSARAVSPQPGRELLLQSTPVASASGGSGGAAVQPQRLGLPAELDTRVSGISEPVGSEGETLLLLPERGPHQVRFESTEGEVLLHVDTGVAHAPETQRMERFSAADPTAEPLPWPANPQALSLLPDSGPSLGAARSLGMLSAEVAARQENVEDGDQLNRPLRTGLELQLGWRQELAEDRVWLRLTPELRLPTEGGPVLGARSSLYVKQLPGQLRLQLSGAAYGQRLEQVLRYRVQGRVGLDRWVRLSTDFALIPGLGFTLETQGGGEGGPPASDYDRNVSWLFGREHPRRLTPRLSLRWQPLQDHVGTLSTWAVSNADLRTADSLNSQLRWSALLFGPRSQARATLAYDASLRMEDTHRREQYLRHGALAGLDWGFWKGRDGRLLVFAEDRALYSGPFGLQNQVSVGLRWDWTGGRGLRDVTPYEEEFEKLLAPRRPTD